MTKYLITGGSGSWGNELTKQLLEKEDTEEIRIYSRGELAQVMMKRKFNNPKLKFIIGDVRSLNRLNEATKGVNIVYHLAALKHVPICEENSWESVNTNITGVENVIRSSINNDVGLVVDVSTDKACSPLNMYGACKSVGEKLIIEANNRTNKTAFVCVRAGNVIGSNGSVIPFFIEKAKDKQPLPITDYNMTRYFMTLEHAIELVLKAANECVGGEIFVTKMPAAYILDTAVAIWEFYNGKHEFKQTDDDMGDISCNMNNPEIDLYYDTHFPEIGIRPGEKIDEMLVSEYEAPYTVIDNDFRIILPMDGRLDKFYSDYDKMTEKYYSSDQYLMKNEEIKEILIRSGFLK